MDIEAVNKINLNMSNKSEVIKDIRKNVINKKIKNNIDNLIKCLKNHVNDNPWIKCSNKNVYYNYNINGLIPDMKKFKFTTSEPDDYYIFNEKNFKFSGFCGRLLTLQELKMMLINASKEIIGCDNNYYAVILNKKFVYVEVFFNNSCESFCINEPREFNIFCIGGNKKIINLPFYQLFKKNNRTNNLKKVLFFFIKNKLVPDIFKNEELEYYKQIKCIIEEYPELLNEELEICECEYSIYDDLNKNLMIVSDNHIKCTILKSEDDIVKNLITKLLRCDKDRIDLDQYDNGILTDPSRGHWDLFYENKNMEKQDKINDEEYIKVESPLLARNPAIDVKTNGIIGIDFGTKSTVVVYQNNNNITYSMIIGKGNFKKGITAKHYENPTVLEFINLEEFINEYKSKSGRPYTKWNDLTCSHTALESMLNSSSNQFYSHFSELKQWAGDKNRSIRIRDKTNTDYIIKPFLELKDNDINPIEIYAYFIGSYINNMRNGIYLDYLLSFPVTYEKEVRKKIVESFRKGIKKSLPESILNNKDIIEKFRVREGVSEPQAYASCALQEFGFDPEGDEKIFYGVFDFGGGTTDFDYGLFKESNTRKYDYVIQCLGSGGDKYLGGENLLELLAFEVFKENADLMREKGYTFIKPAECEDFNGSVILISESQEARLNTKQLMEALRDFWERPDGYESEYTSGVIKVQLFSKNSTTKTSEDLKMNVKKMEEILNDRIEKGVNNFFENLTSAFESPEVKNINTINIFLAGNSSKSQIVQNIFKKYIEKESRNINKKTNSDKNILINPKEGDKFLCKTNEYVLYPPLGFNTNDNELNNKKITGKTGVAYGLIKCRPGGKIQVISKLGDDGQIAFKYYIGYEKKGKFRCLTSTLFPYNTWEYYDDAIDEDVEIYFSSKPNVITNKVNIEETNRVRITLKSKYDNGKIYYRAVAPSVIEIAVATEEGIKKGQYLEKPISIQLNE